MGTHKTYYYPARAGASAHTFADPTTLSHDLQEITVDSLFRTGGETQVGAVTTISHATWRTNRRGFLPLMSSPTQHASEPEEKNIKAPQW